MITFYFIFGAVTVLVILEVIAGLYLLRTLKSLKENARSAERYIEHESRERTKMYDSLNCTVDTLRDNLYADINFLQNDIQKILEEHKSSKGILKS
jgi:rubrerythrin